MKLMQRIGYRAEASEYERPGDKTMFVEQLESWRRRTSSIKSVIVKARAA